MAKTDYTTWIDYCARTTESVPDSAFNEVATGCRDDDEKFLNAILENPTNFILVPTKERGHLACVHHCSVHEDDLSGIQIVIGVNGARFTSPWKATPLDKVNASLRTPSRRKQPKLLIPSLKQFLNIESSHEFAELNGVEEEGSNIELLKELPDTHWMSAIVSLDGS